VLDLEEPRGRRSIAITGAPEEIGHEDEAKMDAGWSCVGAKGERVRWAPPVGDVFQRCELMKFGLFDLDLTVEKGVTD
jgi:hypothetical protein